MEIQLPTISASGLQNGDVLSGSINSATYTDHDSVSYLNVKYTGSHSGDDIQVQSYSITENLSDLGYDVTNDDTITVSPRVVTLEAVKTYDGTDNLVGNEVTIGNLVEMRQSIIPTPQFTISMLRQLRVYATSMR